MAYSQPGYSGNEGDPVLFGEDTLDRTIHSQTSSISSGGSVKKERKTLLKIFEVVSSITIDSHPNNIRAMDPNELVSIEFTLNTIKMKMMKLMSDCESNEMQVITDKPQYVPIETTANRRRIPVSLKKLISRLSSMVSDLSMTLKSGELSDSDRAYFVKGLNELIKSITSACETIAAEYKTSSHSSIATSPTVF
ncbi:uncharacterized protein LOC119069414 isoform X2 [Bradysia coprophila]|uniref:uncharacterized protein LOC119069414 isoform X2 n=1 Tax=Bradysia coprophila TaxID=38358 RepID=UPI00187D9E42|nr:uncharacterized protein LOC119069414 isoform X2 [Bradysia coprophila]